MTTPLDLKGLQSLLWNFAGHRTVTTAAKCGILSRLALSPATVDTLSEDLELAPGGRLCVVEFQIDPDRCGPVLGTLFAIHMRDFGDTWTEADISSWMTDAGLGSIERTDVGPTRWIITGHKR